MKKNYYPRILSYLEISSLKLKKRVLLIPILSLLLLCILLNFNILEKFPYIFKVIRFIIFFLMPGFYLAILVGEDIKLGWEGIIVLDILISTSISMFVCIYLSFILSEINQLTISYSLLFVTLFSYLVCRSRILKSEILRRKLVLFDTSKILFCLIFSFFIGFILIIRVIPLSYWKGWDPWVNAPVVRIIVNEGLNPFELPRRFQVSVVFSGFYYFLASVKGFTGISLYTITRFGGPFLAGMVSMITYLVVKRLEGTGAGLLASFFLLLNPFFIKRFSMALRENFTYVFFLVILFLFVTGKQKLKKDYSFRFYYIFTICLFLAVILISHSLTPLIINGIIFLKIVFYLFKDRRDYALELLLALLFSLLIAAPYLKMIFSTFNWVITNQVPTSTIISILFILISSLVAFLIYYKQLMRLDFFEKHGRIGFFILTIVLLLGSFNSILFPKTFPILGSYNPLITLKSFATSILPLAILGFISVLWIPMPITMMFFSFIVVLIMNFPNLDMAFPLFRLVIYISWLLSYGAVKGLKSIYDLYSKPKEASRVKLWILHKEITIGNLKPYIIICSLILIASPMIIIDFNASKPTFSYHNQEDIDSTLKFASLIKENDIIIPQGWTPNILRYVGVDFISDNALYSTSDPQNFSKIILSKYPNASRALIFMIKRWVGNKNYLTPPLYMLETYGLKQQIGNILFYIIELPFIFEETGPIISPIVVSMPQGSQWIHVNITNFDFSEAGSMIIKIINNSTQKNFFVVISDIYGNKTEKLIFILRTGKSSYQIPLTDIKDKLNLSRLEKLTFCFSWWDKSEIDLIIESITLVSIK